MWSGKTKRNDNIWNDLSQKQESDANKSDNTKLTRMTKFDIILSEATKIYYSRGAQERISVVTKTWQVNI